jgi:hypothetical protein
LRRLTTLLVELPGTGGGEILLLTDRTPATQADFGDAGGAIVFSEPEGSHAALRQKPEELPVHGCCRFFGHPSWGMAYGLG